MARSPAKPAGSPRFILIAATFAGILVVVGGSPRHRAFSSRSTRRPAN